MNGEYIELRLHNICSICLYIVEKNINNLLWNLYQNRDDNYIPKINFVSLMDQTN